MTAMNALKDASWTIHLRLEKRLAVKQRFSELSRYREHIARLECFHSAVETEWRPLLESALTDFQARRKAPLLANDLEAAGGAQIAGAAVPTVADTSSALGAFYVLEGATLGGQHLLPLVEAKLGFSAEFGASYFASYGPDVQAMWKLFGATVENHCTTPDTTACAIAAARATFLALETWLCGEQS
jgi:heme oxygenase